MFTILDWRHDSAALRGPICRQLSARTLPLRIDPDSTVIVTDGCQRNREHD